MFSDNLDVASLRAIYKLTILQNPYIPYDPTDKQLEFLLNFNKEVLYGGAAGGGKSVALLMAALMFVDVADYKAIILRRNYSQLTLPGALIDIAHEWLGNTDAKWISAEKQWAFPSGATLNFGHLDSENDKYRYQGAAFHFVGFDELTQFVEGQYTYLFSRGRKQAGSRLPLRFMSTSNPGGIGHDWVKNRFIEQSEQGRVFIRAGLADNPYLDRQEYEDNLNQLDPVTKKQLRDGDWDVIEEAGFLKRERFEIVDDYPKNAFTVRYWDLAGTQEAAGKDSDYTAGVKMCCYRGQYWIIDVIRERLGPIGVESLVKQTAQTDGHGVEIYMEQEPGSSGAHTISHYARNVLEGFVFRGIRNTKNKLYRARPFAAAVENSNVRLLKAPWNRAFIDECAVFPQKGYHDDQVDAAGGAFEQLTKPRTVRINTARIDRASRLTRGF